MTVYVIYTRYYDFNNKGITIGGVQTYIQGLVPVFKSLGYETDIYQCGDRDDEIKLSDGSTVYQINTTFGKTRDRQISIIVSKLMQRFDDSTDILLFMANEIAIKTDVTRSIAIQHGISWDTLSPYYRPDWQDKIGFYLKARRAYNTINNLKVVKNLVCVDHNFPNWLRATAARFYVTITVIPNFTEVPPLYSKPTNSINIIFARRLFDYRGARLFADSIAKILPNYPNVHVTIAGTGPEESYMKSCLKEFQNQVIFTQYKANESHKVHASQHIAVVPTMGSEGTSLSLLEAMASQCAVVSTDIGGLSNIVIDGFNAIYSEPTIDSVSNKIIYLIENLIERERIALNAYETVRQGFSYEIWENKWKNLILKILGRG